MRYLGKFIRGKISKIIGTSLCLSCSLTGEAVLSAEKIRVIYGPLDLSVAIESLEIYANTGEIKQDLGLYLGFFDEATRQQIRETLQKRFVIDQVIVSRVASSSLGTDLIRQLGHVIRISNNINGLYGIRGAIVEAAANSEGFTVIDVMRNFPVENIYVDAELLLRIQDELEVFDAYRESAIATVKAIADQETTSNPILNLKELADLRQTGPFTYTQQKITVTKAGIRQTPQGLVGSYSFSVDLYMPENSPQPVPLVIISHGFGSLKENFSQIASHLASYGYVVAVPEHIGSDLAYRQELLQGNLSTALSPMEYLDRPLDITYLIDELERLVETDPNWQARVDLARIGVIGDSLGATTVLTLAGADINVSRLRQECEREDVTINVALILQCRAAFLPPLNFNLQDHRIKAVIAAHPLTSAIFGPESLEDIEIPTLIVAGSEDIITPVVQEQLHPFVWLQNEQKHLVVFEPGTHFTSSEVPDNNLADADSIPSVLIGDNRQIASEYFFGLSVAFMGSYLQQDDNYLPYLTAPYGQQMSQDDLNIYQIENLPPQQLEAGYQATPPLAIIPPRVVPKPPVRDIGIIAEIRETGVLKMAMRRDAIPFGYLNQQGDWTGYCTDFADTFAKYLQSALDLPIPLQVVKLQSTLANRLDLVAAETVHFECGPNTIRNDLDIVSFSTPFFITGTHFLVPEAKVNLINPNYDLSGVKIGVLRDTTNEF